MVVLIGPNGAGKSTLLKSIAGFLKPREGAITFEGKPIGGLKPARDHAAGRRLRAAGGERVSLAHRRGESRNGRLCGPPRHARSACRPPTRAFPILAERRSAGGAHALRRPAPDARDGDGADGGAAPDAARRAVRRPLARRAPGIVRADQGPAARRHDRHYGRAERARCTGDCGPRLSAGRRLATRARATRAPWPRMRRCATHSLAADRCYHRLKTQQGEVMHTRSLITRRTALLTGAGAIAAPFVVTTPGFGQTGPIKLAGLVSLTGSGSPFGPNSRVGASGGGRSGQRRGRPARPQARISRRGRPDQRRGRRARGAQADRRRQGLGDHERVGVGGRQRGAAAVLGEQGDAARHLGRGLDRRAAAPGLFRAHAAAHGIAGQGVRPLRPHAGREEHLPDDAADAVHPDGVRRDPRDRRAEGREGRAAPSSTARRPRSAPRSTR